MSEFEKRDVRRKAVAIILGATGLLVGTVARANEVMLDDYNYFVIVPDASKSAKFQVSLKAPIIDEKNTNAWSWTKGFWLFYKQKSFWEIGEASAPFSEHNFNPGAYYQMDVDKWFKVDGGFEHISNGLDGERSRSMNRVFIRPTFRFDGLFRDEDEIRLQLKAWTYTGETEPDNLEDYWGQFAGDVTWFSDGETNRNSIQLRVIGQVGNDSEYYGVNTQVLVPLKRALWFNPKFNPDIFVDWWYGYGQRLLTLEEKENTVRIGIAFTITP